MEFVDEIKIPKERIGVLVGKKGKTKRMIEDLLNVEIDVDSATGDVEIRADDGFNLFKAKNVILAISRGFNPQIAKKLAQDDYSLEIVDITDYANTKNAKIRLRGRVIGRDGKARENLERLTNTNIEVFGKTVAIIGYSEDVVLAKKAIEMLLAGSKHGTVYKFLERINKRKRFEHMLDSVSTLYDLE